MRPTISVTASGAGERSLGERSLGAALLRLTKKRALVGIPASAADRRFALQTTLKNARMSKKRRARFVAALRGQINNAQILYIFTNGSPLHHQPPRPVIEPAIEDPENSVIITAQLELALNAALDDKEFEVYLRRAGQAAENAARKWFTNPKNGWAPNAPSTIRRKGSSRPGIDLGEMRKSLTYLVVED